MDLSFGAVTAWGLVRVFFFFYGVVSLAADLVPVLRILLKRSDGK